MTAPCSPTVVDGASVVFSRNRVKSRWRCSTHCCVYWRFSFRVIYVMCYFNVCCIIISQFSVYLRVIGNVFDRVIYKWFFYVIVLFWLVLFGGFTKQTGLLGSNKILFDSMLPYFIDTVVIQIKDIIESNSLFHWRQINIS